MKIIPPRPRSLAVVLCLVTMMGCRNSNHTTTTDSQSTENKTTATASPTEDTPTQTSQDAASYAIAFPRNEQDCTEESAAKTTAWLQAWYAWRGTSDVVAESGQLPTLPGSSFDGSSIEFIVPRKDRDLERDHLSVDDVLSRVDINVKGTARERMIVKNYPEYPMVFAFAFHRDVSLGEVALVLWALREQRPLLNVALAFEQNGRPDELEPWPEEFVKRIDELANGTLTPVSPWVQRTRRTKFGAGTYRDETQKLKECEAFKNWYVEVVKYQGSAQYEKFNKELGGIWLACGCEIDLELAISLLTWGASDTINTYVPMAYWTPVVFSTNPEDRIQLGEDRTWGELIQAHRKDTSKALCINHPDTKEDYCFRLVKPGVLDTGDRIPNYPESKRP